MCTIPTLRTGPRSNKSLVPVSKPSVIESGPCSNSVLRPPEDRQQQTCQKAHRVIGSPVTAAVRPCVPYCPGCAERFAAGWLAARGHAQCTRAPPIHPSQVRPIFTVLRKGDKVHSPATNNSWLPPPLASVLCCLSHLLPPSRVCWLLLPVIDRSLSLPPVLHSLDDCSL